MIITLNSFGRGFSPLSNPKHKTCLLRRANKKRNKRRYIICKRVNRDLLTSVLTSTCILHRTHPVVEIVLDPICGSLYGGAIKSVPCVALGYTNPYAVPAGYVHLYTLPIRTDSIMHCLPGRCRIRYRVFPTKTPEVYCTVGS
jgi:hypothetical protein